MTYEECMKKKEIIGEYTQLDIRYQGQKYIISIGDEVGRLKVVNLVRFVQGGITRKGCICLCDCGEYIGPSRLGCLLDGELVSCGCYSSEIHSKMLKEKNYKHGESVREHRTKLYTIWASMIDRAENANRPDSKYYADKGITVCDEWHDFTVFRDWANNNGYVDGLSIDRKENSLGYCPTNCRWVMLSEQNKNKTNNRYLEYNGKTLTITDWGRLTGLRWDTINARLKAGKTVGQALGFED